MTAITDRQIETLRTEAGTDGDLVQVAICRIAPGEDAPGEAADPRGWTDYTGSGLSRPDLASIEAVREAADPVEAARYACEDAISAAAVDQG